MQCSIITSNGHRNILVVDPALPQPLATSDDHPNFDRILAAVTAGEDAQVIADLFDTAKVAAEKFDHLSERVTVRGGRVYFDGDEVDDALTQQVVRFAAEGVEDWKPLVAFYEKLQTNPLRHSREQLYSFLRAHDFTITPSGDLIAYKGVSGDSNGGYQSGSSGHAIRNGEDINGYIPNAVGDVIEMPRSEVVHDPGAHCSVGLHVGTFDYAQSYAHGAMLKVEVNPRDVVSVPHNAGGGKVRVCRYRVLEIIGEPVASVIDGGYQIGDRVVDAEGDHGWISRTSGAEFVVAYDDSNIHNAVLPASDLRREEDLDVDYCDECGEFLDDCECI